METQKIENPRDAPQNPERKDIQGIEKENNILERPSLIVNTTDGFVRMGLCIVRRKTAGIAQGDEGQGRDQVYCCRRVGRAGHRNDAFHGRSRQRRNRHRADFDVFDAGDHHPCNMDNLQR